MTEDDQIYVLLVHATAGTCNTNKAPGNRHPIIVLVREPTLPEAQSVAMSVLDRNFWELPEIKRIAPLEPKLGTSSILEGAIADAASHGVSYIVYDNPILPQ